MAALMPAVSTDAHPSTIRIDLAYGLISVGATAIWSVMSGWLLYFYLPPAGSGRMLVPATLYSGVILGVRTLSALAALSVGYLSDRTRTRWGRRVPFMFASAARAR